MNAVEVYELTKWYDHHPAVDRICFKIKEKQIFGLLGPNGAGKTTTIKMLTTLLPLSSGLVKIKGLDIRKFPTKIRRLIGYVPQGLSSDKDLTGYENLLLSTRLFDVDKNQIEQLIDFVGLTGYEGVLVSHYSGGTLRKLEMAQALIHHPSVLFVDEPSVGLDPVSRKMLWDLLSLLRKKWGMTILISTHDMQEADFLCDVVAIMKEGRLIVIDEPENLKKEIGEDATLGDVYFKHTGVTFNGGTR